MDLQMIAIFTLQKTLMNSHDETRQVHVWLISITSTINGSLFDL